MTSDPASRRLATLRTVSAALASSAGHVDLYDRVDLIPFDRLAAFFDTNLGTAR